MGRIRSGAAEEGHVRVVGCRRLLLGGLVGALADKRVVANGPYGLSVGS